MTQECHLEGEGLLRQDGVLVPDGLVRLGAQAVARRVLLPEGAHVLVKDLKAGPGVCCAGSSMHDQGLLQLQAHLRQHCN